VIGGIGSRNRLYAPAVVSGRWNVLRRRTLMAQPRRDGLRDAAFCEAEEV
jgi:hypothetical protein